MRRGILVFMAALLLPLSAAFADGGPVPERQYYDPTPYPAPESGAPDQHKNYFSATGGVFLPDNYETSFTESRGEDEQFWISKTVDPDNGYDVSLTYGRQLNRWLSFEIEGAHGGGLHADGVAGEVGHRDGDEVEREPFSINELDINADQTRLTANARFNAPVGGGVTLYALGGIGGALTTGDVYLDRQDCEQNCNKFLFDVQDYSGVWQAGGGVTVDLTDRWFLEATGRYVQTIGLDLGPLEDNSEFGGWTARAGVGFRF